MRGLYRRIFLNSPNIERSSYLWNALAGVVFAMQSAVMLIVISRTNGLDDSGVFSIAYAIGSLMSFIGEYGVRNYQVSDVNEENGFEDYFTSRLITCTAMILALVGYAVYGILFLEYTREKFLVILMIGAVKLVESFVDVLHGNFQQKGRLDVAAKADTLRISAGMIICMICLVITGDLLLSCIVWAAASLAGLCLTSFPAVPLFGRMGVRFRRDAMKRIFFGCFPLFVGSFLLLYVSNAPKYAIDSYMTDTDQACYNFIFMPVFVVSMMAKFIYNPVLTRMALAWDEGDIRQFRALVRRPLWIIGGLTLLAIAVALTIGCPVLGFMYNADLHVYRLELTVLMVGGGMLALVQFFAVVITVIRYQKYLSLGYVIAAVAAWLISGILVSGYGIRGASILYSAVMTLLALIFSLMLILSERSAIKKRREV